MYLASNQVQLDQVADAINEASLMYLCPLKRRPRRFDDVRVPRPGDRVREALADRTVPVRATGQPGGPLQAGIQACHGGRRRPHVSQAVLSGN